MYPRKIGTPPLDQGQSMTLYRKQVPVSGIKCMAVAEPRKAILKALYSLKAGQDVQTRQSQNPQLLEKWSAVIIFQHLLHLSEFVLLPSEVGKSVVHHWNYPKAKLHISAGIRTGHNRLPEGPLRTQQKIGVSAERSASPGFQPAPEYVLST
uniref:Uncharacterized protein n=2 Tax=Lygus hesperus TaxID=30085 RepID=A0A146LNQ5_LYGHE